MQILFFLAFEFLFSYTCLHKLDAQESKSISTIFLISTICIFHTKIRFSFNGLILSICHANEAQMLAHILSSPWQCHDVSAPTLAQNPPAKLVRAMLTQPLLRTSAAASTTLYQWSSILTLAYLWHDFGASFQWYQCSGMSRGGQNTKVCRIWSSWVKQPLPLATLQPFGAQRDGTF